MRFLYALLLILVVPFASSHLEGGQDQVVGPFLIDLGYSPAQPNTGDFTFFAVNLINQSSGRAIVAPETFVRISKGNEILFAGSLANTQLGTSFSYTFFDGGDYEVLVRFADDGLRIAEHTFILPVKGTATTGISPLIPMGAIVLVIALAVAGFAFRKLLK